MRLLDHFVVKPSKDRPAFLYMVFDFMDTSLWLLWKQHRRVLPPERAVRFIRHVAAGIAYLHEVGIAHTDLSMSNMLIGHENMLRIADFGGAANAAHMVIPPGTEITTEYVRAPEVILGCLRPSLAVDMWAVGVVSMALLVGSLVFYRPVADDGHERGRAQSFGQPGSSPGSHH